MKEKKILICEKCLSRNYKSCVSNIKNFNIKKYCNKCNAHTIHKISK